MDKNHKDKILIVDDEEFIRMLLTQELEAEGFEVDCAVNGFDCLQKLNTYQPDLILLDISMPDIDGIETAREIRKLKPFDKTPIIFLTGASTTETLRKGFDAGGDEYLNKPISVDELSIRIKAILRMYRAEVESEQLSRSFQYLLVQDFLNYSTAVKLPLLMLKDDTLGSLNQQQNELLDFALKALDEHIKLLQETAIYSKFNPRSVTLNKIQTNFLELLEQSIEKLNKVFRQKNIEVIKKFSSERILLDLDRSHILQALDLLLTFAAERTPNGEKIYVDISRIQKNNTGGSFIEVCVQDHGKKIEKDELGLLVDRVEQAKLNKITLSNNLSLTISKLIIEAHNGKLWCENAPESGNYYKFTLPLNINKSVD